MQNLPKTLVMLPGMHGTGELFEGLCDCLPPHVRAIRIEYPPDKINSYDNLFELVRSQVDEIDENFIVLGESFSGPLAIRIAEAALPNLTGVILVATFFKTPLPRMLQHIARPALFRRPPPKAADEIVRFIQTL